MVENLQQALSILTRQGRLFKPSIFQKGVGQLFVSYVKESVKEDEVNLA